MSLTGRPSYTLLYTWAALLSLLQVHLWQEQHHDLPLTQPSVPICPTCFRRLLRQPLHWRDKRLLDHLRENLERPLASIPYGQSLSPHHPPWANVASYNLTENILRNIFGNERGGVFVEVGAQDGLWLSNTWWLEAERGWRGLLIEADPHNYLRLRTSPRTAFTLPACVTCSLYTTQEVMVRRNKTWTTDEEVLRHQQGHTKLEKYATDSDHFTGHTFTTTCYSIFSVLAAAGITNIDLLTFDVTGGGFEMLQEFLENNVQLGNKLKVRAILYQDNELPQFFSMESFKEQLKEFGYSLLKTSMDHYLVYSDFIIEVV